VATLTEKRTELEDIEVQGVCHIIGQHGGLCGEPESCTAFCDCQTTRYCPGCHRLVCPDCKLLLRRALDHF
jgi:hypothetical protein